MRRSTKRWFLLHLLHYRQAGVPNGPDASVPAGARLGAECGRPTDTFLKLQSLLANMGQSYCGFDAGERFCTCPTLCGPRHCFHVLALFLFVFIVFLCSHFSRIPRRQSPLLTRAVGPWPSWLALRFLLVWSSAHQGSLSGAARRISFPRFSFESRILIDSLHDF